MVLVRNVELTSYHQEEFWERSKGERMLPCPRNHKQCYNDHHNLLQSNCPPVKNKIKLKKKKKLMVQTGCLSKLMTLFLKFRIWLISCNKVLISELYKARITW
jgi:hypothetical protein